MFRHKQHLWNDAMINGVTVVDQKTGAVYQGTVDFQPMLD